MKKMIDSYKKYYDKFETFDQLISEVQQNNKLAIECINTMEHLEQNLTHYLGNKTLLNDNKNKIFYIIEQENYEHDFMIFQKYLSSKYKITIPEDYCKTKKEFYERKKSHQKDLYVLSDENKEFFKEYFKNEYEIYNYLKSIKEEVNNKLK